MVFVVNFSRVVRCSCVALAACGFLLPFAPSAQSKPIRLRNETILTGPPTNSWKIAKPLTTPATVSGLYLIQFTAAPQPDQRAQLSALGVELLRYVPEDAFIAKLEKAQLTQIQALGFVHWVGPYRPEHKIHPRLAATRAKSSTNGLVAVNILLASSATRAEINEVRGHASAVHFESHLRQGTIVRALVPSSKIDALAQSSAVLWIEPATKRKLIDEAASKIVGGDDGNTGTPTLTQQLGYNGSNVLVGIADTGLDNGTTNNMHPDLAGRVASFIYYPPLTNAADEHSHGTHVAGIVAGNAATGEVDASGALYGLGVASGASLVIERIFDGDGNEVDPPPSDEKLTQDATRAGAKIGSNSWGNDVQGEYDLDASTFDELVRDADTGTPGDQPYILEFSAGNAGPDSQTLDSPATGKNVIATGASENGGQLDFGLYDDGPDTMADFSSRGPCEDGRIKPDVVAPGTFVASLLSASASDALAWLPIDNFYIYMGGTSQAGPHASGAAAVFVQYYKSLHTNAVPSPALVKAALINSAEEMDENNGGPGPVPNNDEGWGRLNIANIIGSTRGTEYVDQTTPLTNGATFDHHTFVQASDMPLKITLAYTDVPGFPGALPALVNDLDLEVTAPDGTLYRGNQYEGSESLPNATTTDNINNVEGVTISQPIPGDYLVRVRARNVVQDARLDTQAIDQDFALVVSADLLPQGKGMVLFDRASYTAPGTFKLEVLDTARVASHSIGTQIKSTTAPTNQFHVLFTTGSYGAFTNVVTMVLTNPATGQLLVRNGDVITASYVDASGTNRTATATVDIAPPVLTAVTSSIDIGVITITWQTSEPANSVVYYSTNQSFNLSVTNSDLVTSHSVRLFNLVPGQTYYFIVGSTDLAGNTTINNNSGTNYSFVAVQTPLVLLVDAYETAEGSPVIPDSAYTNALAATGFSWAYWKVTDRGSPQLADLQPFRAIVWRLTDDEINYDGTNNTLSPQQQFMIETYLNGGGSFFMASMGVLSQIGAGTFRQNVLQVAGFVGNDQPPIPCSTCDEDFTVPAVLGATNSPITTGMSMTLDYSQYPSFDLGFGGGGPDTIGPDFSDTFSAGTNATPIFFESVSGKTCGMSYPRNGFDSPGRVVFMSFPLDTIPETNSLPDNETIVLRNALNFLIPGAQGNGTITLDSTAYTIPDQVAVQVGDSDLIGTGQTQVTFSSSSLSNSVTVTLKETSHPGLFQGSISLVPTNTSVGTNQIAVKPGDTLTAKYFDASNKSNVVTTAFIDTTPPTITNVTATPSFDGATISWITSKLSDSTVQAGPSVLLDHSASDPRLVLNHSVTFAGLNSGTIYYYQVASRDLAGNTAVNDNNGNLFTFTTRTAPQPPWFDNLDTGAPGWTTVPDPDVSSNSSWTLGTPSNGLETSAHSGANAWGSDLTGNAVADPNGLGFGGYLISPPVDLSGFSQATLTYWDVYDFTLQNTFEEGYVEISTNSSVPLAKVPIATNFTGSSALDWQQESIDLTPYVGHTVQIIWDYANVAFGGASGYGWLIDDVAITGIAIGSGQQGTLVISKNLGQGTWSLSGQLSQSGIAPTTTISNAPLGQYTVTFSDVPFYHTPPDQSGMLTASNTLVLSGDYTFDDTNHNGISDAWEQFYFGSVSTNRTQYTDTDGDGMTDYAEFIAGTNPTNATSKLAFFPPTRSTNGIVLLQWAAIPGRIYQVETSTNFNVWLPATGWISATGSPMTYSFTNTNSGNSRMFRIQVHP